MEQKKGFNLLRPQLNPEDKWEKIYSWINGTARGIVIFVEVVVIVCFVTRVIVDRQARNLEKQLDENKVILEQMADDEERIREIQSDLLAYESLWNNSNEYDELMTEIYGYDTNLYAEYNISVEDAQLAMTGESTISTIEALEKTMKASESYRNVEVSSYRPQGKDINSQGSFNVRAQIVDPKREPLERNESAPANPNPSPTVNN